MYNYVCLVCGYIFDSSIVDKHGGIAPDAVVEDLPDQWTCPLCGVHMIEIHNTRLDRHTVNEI